MYQIQFWLGFRFSWADPRWRVYDWFGPLHNGENREGCTEMVRNIICMLASRIGLGWNKIV